MKISQVVISAHHHICTTYSFSCEKDKFSHVHKKRKKRTRYNFFFLSIIVCAPLTITYTPLNFSLCLLSVDKNLVKAKIFHVHMRYFHTLHFQDVFSERKIQGVFFCVCLCIFIFQFHEIFFTERKKHGEIIGNINI